MVGRGFTPAGDVRVGDEVAEDRDGVTARLASVVRLETPKPVYNLTVGGTHTYFVRAGSDSLWVHNAKQCGNSPQDIHWAKQDKHIPTKKGFIPGRSELTHPDPQGLLNSGAGTGTTYRGTSGQPGGKEVVDFGQTIGYWVDKNTGARLPTTKGTIHYGGTGSHIIPAYP